MFAFLRPKLDFIEDDFVYKIHGTRDIISGLRLGMVKRSIEDNFRTAEEALKDIERYRYISFLERKTLDYYRPARAYGYTNVSDETALMRMDLHYVDTLYFELSATPAGPLYAAINNEINKMHRKILSYPFTLISPYDPLNVRYR